ncbi:hypothetical protein F2P56_003227 [Juglans regia]|uniref:RNase H type-1 domain-containing protein n=2 Tax=Juglans regia TaxID=51240 RepID=A0A833Y6S3_JUGRE|nr:uncharacterized protein LOC108991162 [Juglans regia]KAF5476475.1 hypothetical protein F2P56_003227 [Juglans regia]
MRMLRELSQLELEIGVAIMYSIWTRRNIGEFDSKFSSPNSVMKRARVCLYDFHDARNEGKSARRKLEQTEQSRKWQTPEGLCVKVNFDAALDLKVQKMGVGVVMKDGRGDVLTSLSAPTMYVTSPFVVECKALRRALKLCKELGCYNVCFEGDAKRVVDTMNKEVEDDSWEVQFVG